MNGFLGFVIPVFLLVPALLIAIPAHEMGHAAAAYFLGDRSVRYFGYFSLDPRRFLEPIGVLAVFVALVGWGKRVPVQPNRIRTPFQRVVHALGGPAANLVLAVVLGRLLLVLNSAGLPIAFELSAGLLGAALFVIVFLNLSIFAFQLLPIPGLDGWQVVEGLFRDRNPRFFFDVNSRRREIWVAAVIAMFVFQVLQLGSLLSLVMTLPFDPASKISLGTCIGYAIPGLLGLHPCLP